MTDDTLVNFGSEIKALGTTDDGAMKFGAWLVLYGDPQNTDATSLRDYFTKSTDFDIEDGDKTTVYWNHGLDPELKRRKLGTATLHMKDAGIWMEGILKARDEYEAKIQEMIKAGKLGASSGVPAHLVERKSVGSAHEIVLWPLGKDASLTHTPAEFRTSAHAIKTLSELMEEDEAAEEIKKYDPRQPRDDLGKWSTSSGGISVGHAIHVMKSEGITDEAHHAAVREAIENGTHKTREDVLKHIDAIHAQNGTTPPAPQAGVIFHDTPLTAASGRTYRLQDANGEHIRGEDGAVLTFKTPEAAQRKFDELQKKQSTAPVAQSFSDAHNAYHTEKRQGRDMIAEDHDWRGKQIEKLHSEATAQLAAAKTPSDKREAQARLDDIQARKESHQRRGEALAAGEPAKEPWQMSLDEYSAANPLPRRRAGETHYYTRAGEMQAKHRDEVAVALQSGKPVPPDVLRQYPNLEHKLPHQWDAIMKPAAQTAEGQGASATPEQRAKVKEAMRRVDDAKMGRSTTTIGHVAEALSAEGATAKANGKSVAIEIENNIMARASLAMHLDHFARKGDGSKHGVIEGMGAVTKRAGEPLTIHFKDEESAKKFAATVNPKSRKSLDESDIDNQHNFTSPDEVVSAITDILRGRMPLEWHSQAVRATVKSLEERIAGVIDTRCVKSGRVLSCDNHERLSQHHAALQAVVEDLGALLEAHKPAADDTDTKALSDVEAQQLMARYVATMARLSGIPLDGVPLELAA